MPNPSKAPRKKKPILKTRLFRTQRDIDAKARTAKRGELQHVRLSVRDSKMGGAPYVVSYAEADGTGHIKRYDRSEFYSKEKALKSAEWRQNFSKTPLVIAKGY
jgi:hypothetical protein